MRPPRAVTVQELTFTSLLVLSATPALMGIPGGWLISTVVLGGVTGTLLILLVPAVYRPIRRLLAALPLVRGAAGQVDTLRQESVVLLTRPVAMASGVLDLARVALAAGALQLLLHAMNIQRGWWLAVLVVAVAYVGGALSFLPGGIGANEASLIGVLIGFGVPVGQAAAVALLERLPAHRGALGGRAARLRRHPSPASPGQPGVLAPRGAHLHHHSLRGGRLSLPLAGSPQGRRARLDDPPTGPPPAGPVPRRRFRLTQLIPIAVGLAAVGPWSLPATRPLWGGRSPGSTCC